MSVGTRLRTKVSQDSGNGFGSGKTFSGIVRTLKASKSSNNAMKLQSDIPVLRATDDEVLPGNPRSRVILSSAAANWRSLIVEEHHIPYLEWKRPSLWEEFCPCSWSSWHR